MWFQAGGRGWEVGSVSGSPAAQSPGKTIGWRGGLCHISLLGENTVKTFTVQSLRDRENTTVNVPLFWFVMIVSSLIPCRLTSVWKSSSAAGLTSLVRPEEGLTHTELHIPFRIACIHKRKWTFWWSLTVKLDYGGFVSRRFLRAQQEHHCVLVIVGSNHLGIDVCSEPCGEESVLSLLSMTEPVDANTTETLLMRNVWTKKKKKRWEEAEKTYWQHGGRIVLECRSNRKLWTSAYMSHSYIQACTYSTHGLVIVFPTHFSMCVCVCACWHHGCESDTWW